ncbi:MAG: DUF998 domain-containing protein [Planctomycetota bacterium]
MIFDRGTVRKETFRYAAGYLGLATVGVFVISFFVFAILTPDFDLVNDYISRLGAKGQPHAVWWNLTGFVAVGILFASFGWSYGRYIGDTVTSALLAIAGLGFAMGAIPTDLLNEASPLSRVHFASICVSLAAWCFVLARMGHVGSDDELVKRTANWTAALSIVPMVGLAAGVFAAPVSHRLVLCVVFGWILVASARLLFHSFAIADCPE